MFFVDIQIDLRRRQTERTQGTKRPFNRALSQADEKKKSKSETGIACI
jgi:hypothetical protein